MRNTSRGGIGAGDVRMAALIGCVLGWDSWSAVICGTFLAFATAGVVMIAAKSVGRSAIPFGPPMVAGAFFALLV